MKTMRKHILEQLKTTEGKIKVKQSVMEMLEESKHFREISADVIVSAMKVLDND